MLPAPAVGGPAAAQCGRRRAWQRRVQSAAIARPRAAVLLPSPAAIASPSSSSVRGGAGRALLSLSRTHATATSTEGVLGTPPTNDAPPQYYFRPQASWPTDVALPTPSPASSPAPASLPDADLVVAGAGPAGLAVADRVARAGFRVCVIDPDPLGIWPNNYGVWVDEFQAMGLADCLEVVWPKARVMLDSTAAGDKRLSRPYGRVDRPRLKRRLLERCAASGVTFFRAAVESVAHADGRSTVTARALELRPSSTGAADASASSPSTRVSPDDFLTACSAVGHGHNQDEDQLTPANPFAAPKTRPASSDPSALVSVRGSLVLDATGHSRRLVEFDRAFDPGYQGAYGIVAEVESHPFDTEEMTFMDWRDDHLEGLPELKAKNAKLPTFLYAMPFSPTRVFLEETSLVARPAVPFDDLKARLEARMKWLGIKVKRVEEEEYCLIPMGGALPRHPQRVLAVGGTAGMVHPSTGFAVSRLLGAAPTVADAIVDALSRPTDKASRAAKAARAGRAAGTAEASLSSSPLPPAIAASLPYAEEPAPAFAAAASITTLPSVLPPRSEKEAERMAAQVWRATWPLARLRQRAFFCFGMDVLLRLDLAETRQFFAAFFALSAYHWHGFLSARLGFLQLIGFGLSLFAKSSPAARANLLARGLPGLVGMLVGLAPTVFGDYYPKDIDEDVDDVEEGDGGGDGAAGGQGKKAEASAAAAPAPVPTTR
jgi:flavin-dependent dehydrogenase